MQQLLLMLPVLVFSVIVHEIAHGWVAWKLGDPTARMLGRLTLDPRPHIDPLFTLLVPVLCALSGSPIFGGAKPVPVNARNFRHPSRDMALVALAGPVSNLLLATLAGVLIRLPLGATLSGIVYYMLVINLVLAAFNLLPIPPLDGSRVMAHFLPGELSARYRGLDRFGMLLIIGVLFLFSSPLHHYLSWFVRTVGGILV